MSTRLTLENAKETLGTHADRKGAEIQEKYGPRIGWQELLDILADRSVVRYPCEVVFDATPLREGEFAYPAAKGESPEEGFAIHVHPYYAAQPNRVPYLVFYQLVLVNYGEFASSDDAEAFGAAALGISRDDYYRALCHLADEISSE
jgi:hypothetical protein